MNHESAELPVEVLAAAEQAAETARAAVLARVTRPLSTREAAAILGRKVGTLQQWRHRGTGPRSRKIDGRVAYDLVDLQSWIDGEGE